MYQPNDALKPRLRAPLRTHQVMGADIFMKDENDDKF